jgi:thioesterase domain-containing protein
VKLFQAQTVAGQAEIIRKNDSTQHWSALVPIQPKGTGTPFFLVPGGSGGHGEMIVYSRLARWLNADQPLYLFQAAGLNSMRATSPAIENIAAEWLKEMRRVQPEGPYLLGGECIGGTAAFEIACQLKAQEQEVGLLVLMDTPFPSDRPWSFYHQLLRPWMKRIRHHRAAILELASEKRWTYLKEKGLKAMRIGAAKMFPASAPPEIRLREAGVSYQKAIQRYRPEPYPGHLVLLVSEGHHAQHPVSGWERLAEQGAKLYIVPGDHTSYIREHDQTTTKQLQACLKKTQQDNAVVHTS